MSDPILNLSPTYTVTHTFSTDDITGTFGGLTQGDVTPDGQPVVDFSAEPIVSDGVELFPISSEFGFDVTDFQGAEQKEFDTDYTEGFVGNIEGEGGEHAGLVVSDSPTDTFKTPAVLGTWLAGIGGNTVKASTEHYSVMQNVLSDQRFPGDPDAEYALDDNLILLSQTPEWDGQFVSDLLNGAAMYQGELVALPEDRNNDGVLDIKDLLNPNESTIEFDIAYSGDYSVTMKDDGKLLFRWGNTVKRPNDIRIETEMELPEEWSQPEEESGLTPLFRVTQAELVTNHTITNNPNDQIRPEDFENEAAIGQLPDYEVQDDGRWVSTADYYAGDGTFYQAGTVLKDPALAEAAASTLMAQIGTLSEDLKEGFTNAWYTTMNREPFEAELDEDGNYILGPRWRLQPDKYGQDLPSIVIPADPSLPPPPTRDEVKYEVGTDTTTVINLLDWEDRFSPLSLNAGYQMNSGDVSENGLNMTDNLDVAFYVKGDIKPARLYDTTLVMSYEQVEIFGVGASVEGLDGSDYLVGQGNNVFNGGLGEDLFVLSYGGSSNWSGLQKSTVRDFEVGTDSLGLIDLGVTELSFDEVVRQRVEDGNLTVSVGSVDLVTLENVSTLLDSSDFLLINRSLETGLDGSESADYIVANELNNTMIGLEGDDILLGAGGSDYLLGGLGDDQLEGGSGDDTVSASDGDDIVDGGTGNDLIGGGIGNDQLNGDTGNDVIFGGLGHDTIDAGDGNDVVRGGFQDDVITGGLGHDTIVGGAGQDVITGDAGNDVIGGGLGDDVIDGGDGNDFLAGGGRNDVLDGGTGNDTINGGDGDDVMTGGDGADLFVFNAFRAGDNDLITDYQVGIDSFLIRTENPETGEANLDNGGNGLQGYVDALNITDTTNGAQMNIDGHLILLSGIIAVELTLEDFQFI